MPSDKKQTSKNLYSSYNRHPLYIRTPLQYKEIKEYIKEFENILTGK